MMEVPVGREFYLLAIDAAIANLMAAETRAFKAVIIKENPTYEDGLIVGLGLGKYEILNAIACMHAQLNNVLSYPVQP